MQKENRQKLITSLPIFLIGLGITGGCLIAGGACYEIPSWRLYSGIIFGGLISLFIGAVSIIGLVKKIPEWSIIWISISIIGFLILLNFISSLEIPDYFEKIILITTLVIGLYIFYLITKQSWQNAGLLGIGLSTSLTLILFFIATNISHNEIRIGYYDAIIGLIYSIVTYLYLSTSIIKKIMILIVILIINALLIYIFDLSMQKLNNESQLLYLLTLSNGLLFIGIIFHFVIRKIKLIIGKK